MCPMAPYLGVRRGECICVVPWMPRSQKILLVWKATTPTKPHPIQLHDERTRVLQLRVRQISSINFEAESIFIMTLHHDISSLYHALVVMSLDLSPRVTRYKRNVFVHYTAVRTLLPSLTKMCTHQPKPSCHFFPSFGPRSAWSLMCSACVNVYISVLSSAAFQTNLRYLPGYVPVFIQSIQKLLS
ncbi:hypothetical protein Plhal304r1_c016g0057571 [Plasmopara halstedii]